MLVGEVIHSLSLLPRLLQKDEYKETHVLQCIIRIQLYSFTASANQASNRFAKKMKESA